MEVTDLSELSVICPSNDGEAKMIIDIANRYGLDIRISKQPWGATLNKEPWTSFLNLKKFVAIVEIPGVKEEEDLRNSGHVLIILDHHKYQNLDRRKTGSCIEQFAELIGYNLSRFEKGIAINDRSYIYGLRDAVYSEDEILQIREYDLVAQGLNPETKEFLTLKFKEAKETAPGIMMFELPSHINESYLRDLIALKIDLYMSTVIFKRYQDGSVSQIVFTGRPQLAIKLESALAGSIGGDEKYALIWWISNRDVTNEVKDILGLPT